MPELKEIAQFGVAGLSVYLFWRLASNHIDHNTEVLGELRDLIREIKDFLHNKL